MRVFHFLVRGFVADMVRSSLSARTPVYDPHELPELEIAKYASSEDLTSQFRDFQKRAIVFHSNPSPKDVEIAGHMRLNLAVQSDAPDFDLWAQVLMVLSDGSTIQLGEDIRRACFRNSFFKEELLRPGQTHMGLALVRAKPETVIAWHRRGFRLYQSWKKRYSREPSRIWTNGTAGQCHDALRR
ncbi:MAG: CocE/NonD family hydrolase C-terminal non-catalytic domain-containing protein [Candidatus Acidiferrales bacterium]|jgi:hypothetical protein